MPGRLSSLREDILVALRGACGGDAPLLVIHASLSHLRLPAGGVRHAFLAAFERLLAEGRTIAIPTYTFSFCRSGDFDLRRSRSETGPLGEWLLALPGAARTPHPIYSYAVAGPLSARILACRNSTTFGDDSTFALYEELDARYVMLGCDWRYCSQFHRYEEAAAVPYRQYKDFGATAGGTGARMFVRRLELDPRNDFSPAVDAMRVAAAIGFAELGAGRIESARCSAIAAASRALLRKDPYVLLENAREVAYAVQAAEATAAPLRIALLGMSNLEPLAGRLRARLPALLRDRGANVHTVAFGQLRQELLGAKSVLSTFKPELSLFVDRLEDVLRVDSLDEALTDGSRIAALDEHLDSVARHVQASASFVAIARFSAVRPSAHAGVAKLLQACNQRLEEFAATHPGVHLFDPAATENVGPPFDARAWYLGRIPYSTSFSEHLAGVLCGIVLAHLGRSARAIVVDLDNTLWGGVVAEDGVGGVQIGADFPGNCHVALQRALRSLSERGVALAICSKNDEELVARVFAERPEMLLRREDFAASLINWDPKWKNLLDIAESLNLGLENILFVDDSPVEREQVARYAPGVKVLELPADPALYVDALLSSPFLHALEVTAEDRKRAASYRARGQIESLRSQHTRPEEFYASLQMTLHLFPLDESNAVRAEQLLAKTNQFNTTTRRYARRDLERLVAEGARVAIIGLEDRFTGLENIGVLILKRDGGQTLEIDALLLSCRVLGRGVESGVLAWVREQARLEGHRHVRGAIVETPRNTPVRSLYRDHGFSERPPGVWTAAADEAQAAPAWLTITNHFRSAPTR